MSAPAFLRLSEDEDTAFVLAEVGLAQPPSESSLPALLDRRTRECRALQAAWAERAACHERLTAAGVPAGDLVQRLAWVLQQLAMAKTERGGL